MNEFDIKALWKQTTQEPLVLTVEALHHRSLAFHRTVWRQDMAELMGCVIVALTFGFEIGAAPNAVTRLGELLAIVSAIVAAFQVRRYAATRPSDASTGASLLAFHTAELQRRRDLLRSLCRWIVVPIMISIWVILVGFAQARPGSAGTLLTFACVMTVIGLVLSLANMRGARRLQRDIDALADAKLLTAVTARLGARASLSWLQDADHSWHVPARSGRTDSEVRAAALQTLAGWIDSLL